MATSHMVRAYLVFYNVAQFCGWSLVFVRTLVWLLEAKSKSTQHDDAYEQLGWLVERCQGLAFLEVVHALLGFVRGSPATAFLQWFGRSNVLFGLLRFLPDVQGGWPVPALFLAWSAVEIIRYPWYAVTLVRSQAPAWLTWLRYTIFIPLYPVGVAAEVAIILRSLPLLQKTRLHSVDLPNAFNFAFDYHIFSIVGIFVLYPIAFPWIFNTLLQQRRRRLGPKSQSLKAKGR